MNYEQEVTDKCCSLSNFVTPWMNPRTTEPSV